MRVLGCWDQDGPRAPHGEQLGKAKGAGSEAYAVKDCPGAGAPALAQAAVPGTPFSLGAHGWALLGYRQGDS